MLKFYEFLKTVMGNSKHSTVTSTPSFHDHRQQQLKREQLQREFKRRKSDPEDYAGVQLGRLRSVDFRLGKVLLKGDIESISSARVDALLLDILWTPDTFVFSRTSPKYHQGFGFGCDINFCASSEAGVGQKSWRYVARQMTKPRRRWEGLEDSPLDIFDLQSHGQTQRQVLGLVLKKQEVDEKSTLEGVDTLSIQGIIGQIKIKQDWTSAYEILDSEGEEILIARRFNRISGGIEFQIYSEREGEVAVCIATFIRLEESKFILKIYAPCSPSIKALMISFALFFIYVLSR